jgi:hypothetical protein
MAAHCPRRAPWPPYSSRGAGGLLFSCWQILPVDYGVGRNRQLRLFTEGVSDWKYRELHVSCVGLIHLGMDLENWSETPAKRRGQQRLPRVRRPTSSNTFTPARHSQGKHPSKHRIITLPKWLTPQHSPIPLDGAFLERQPCDSRPARPSESRSADSYPGNPRFQGILLPATRNSRTLKEEKRTEPVDWSSGPARIRRWAASGQPYLDQRRIYEMLDSPGPVMSLSVQARLGVIDYHHAMLLSRRRFLVVKLRT